MKKLRELREKNNMRQEDVAKALGITRATYANYENDKTQPPIDIIKLFAKYFHTSLDVLLEFQDENKIDKNSLKHNELEIIDKVLQLDDDNQKRLLGYVYALWQNQQNEKETIKKVKGE